MNKIQVSAGGAVVFWSAGPTQRELLSERLKQLGLGQYAPAQRTDTACLKDVLRGCCRGSHTNDKDVQAHDNPKVNGFEVVDVQRGDERNYYVTDFSARVDENGTVITSHGLAYANLHEMQKAFDTYRQSVPGTSVGTSLVKILAHLKGTALRPKGGVYWIPDESLDQWQRVVAAVEECGQNTQAYTMTTLMDAEAVRAVRDAVCREVTEAAEALKRDIAEGDLGEKALESRVSQAKSLHDRIEEYTEILGETTDLLHKAVRVPEMAAASAISIQDDEEVFGGVFA